MSLQDWIADRILVFDGAMGTMLQEKGMRLGELPELLNLRNPALVTKIHRSYVAAGADVITANTFQAHRWKLGPAQEVAEVVAAGIRCAREAGAKRVALDVGPLGQLMAPMGTVELEEAYQVFREQMVAGERAGADLILLETFSDPYEAKAAILAAKENTKLPVICSMSFQEDGRSFVGCDPLTATVYLQGLGVDALGVNCSLGPEALKPVVRTMLRNAKVPVILQGNAGLPEIREGQTVYDMSPERYGTSVLALVQEGVRIIGGCCGTTPAFISWLKEHTQGLSPVVPDVRRVSACCSGSRTVVLDGVITEIGERLNPTGKKRMQQALRTGDDELLIDEALAQVRAGAQVLDVNVGLPELDEPKLLTRVVRRIQSMTDVPLQIDSADPAAIEAAVRQYNGKPLINSVNGKEEVMEAVFPIAKKYGAIVVGLTLDEQGIPETAEGRLAIARRIRDRAGDHGIPPEDLIIDCLVLTASAQQAQVMETLRGIRLVKRELELKTVLGVSNISFGLPDRPVINAGFLGAALGAGLDAAILNPLSPRYRELLSVFRVLNNEDKHAAAYIESRRKASEGQEKSRTASARNVKSSSGILGPLDGQSGMSAKEHEAGNSGRLGNPEHGEGGSLKSGPEEAQGTERGETDSGGWEIPLREIILQGRRDQAGDCVQNLLKTRSPLEIIDHGFIPALNLVGQRFESGESFLPQLMLSAQAVQTGFQWINRQMEQTGETGASKGKILLATVQGDIHDIGKNIVGMLLKSYGFQVVDLGKDVPIQQVVETIRTQEISLAGLSALMTTTVKNMKDTIAAVRQAGLNCSFMVGGAVLNEEYKRFVGAEFYAKDAMESVAIANRFFGIL